MRMPDSVTDLAHLVGRLVDRIDVLVPAALPGGPSSEPR